MQPQLQTETSRKKKPRAANPLSVLISIIRKSPGSGMAHHKRAFQEILRQDGYEDYLDAVIEKWVMLEYSTASQAANPPSAEELRARAAERAAERDRDAAAATELIASRLLDLMMANGKALRDCTGRECKAMGGWLAKIAGKVRPAQKVGAVLSEIDLRALFKEGR